MSEWEKVRLGDICDLIAGFAFKSGEFGDDFNNKVVKIKDIQPPYINLRNCNKVDNSRYDQNRLSKFKVRKGDYLLAMTGATIGKIGIIVDDDEAYINQRVLLFRPREELCNKMYLYFALLCSSFESYIYNFVDSDTAQPNISSGTIGKFEINLPPLEEQERIAKILGSLDDKIELNNKINRNLEAQAEALFKQWFVDFDFPDPSGNPYRTSGGAMIDSPMGKIPDGWRVGKFTDIVSILGGGTPKTTKDNYWGGDIPFFTPKDAGDVCYTFDTEKYITTEGLNNCNSRLYSKNTVFITARGTVGKIAFAGCEMAMNQSCYALVGKDSYSQLFVYNLTQQTISALKGKANGAVFDAITTRDFESENIIIPTLAVVADYNSIVESIYEAIHLNVQEKQRLVQLRDSMLPKLINNLL